MLLDIDMRGYRLDGHQREAGTDDAMVRQPGR